GQPELTATFQQGQDGAAPSVAGQRVAPGVAGMKDRLDEKEVVMPFRQCPAPAILVNGGEVAVEGKLLLQLGRPDERNPRPLDCRAPSNGVPSPERHE